MPSSLSSEVLAPPGQAEGHWVLDFEDKSQVASNFPALDFVVTLPGPGASWIY
jgi:hypothetical protein